MISASVGLSEEDDGRFKDVGGRCGLEFEREPYFAEGSDGLVVADNVGGTLVEMRSMKRLPIGSLVSLSTDRKVCATGV